MPVDIYFAVIHNYRTPPAIASISSGIGSANRFSSHTPARSAHLAASGFIWDFVVTDACVARLIPCSPSSNT